MSVRSRVVLLVLVSVAPFLVLLAWNLEEQRRDMASVLAAEAATRAQAYAAHIRQAVDDARTLTRALAGAPDLLSLGRDRCAGVLGALFWPGGTVLCVAVVDAGGRVVCSSRGLLAGGSHVPGTDYLRRVRSASDAVVGVPVRYGPAGRFGVPVASAIRGLDGGVRGAVLVVVDLAAPRTEPRRSEAESDPYLVMGPEKTVLARWPGTGEWVGREAAGLPLGQALDHERESGRVPGLDGRLRVYGWEKVLIPGVPGGWLWAVAGVSPEPSALGLRRSLWRSAGLALVGLVLAVGMATATARAGVTVPMDRLVAAAKRLGKGDRSVLTSLAQQRGEFGYLASVLDRLAEVQETQLARIQTLAARYRTLVERGPAVVFEIRRSQQGNGRWALRYVSPQAETWLGVSGRDLRADPYLWEECLSPRDRVVARRVLERLSSGSRPGGFEHRLVRPDGSSVWVHTRILPVVTHQGEHSFLGVVVDVDRRKRAEEALVAYARRLEESNRELERFAYVASHDLQEPLRVVASYVELLARRYRGRLDPDADDFIGFAVEGVHRMRTLIEGLLEYSRVTTQARPAGLVDAGECLDEALANLAALIEEAGAQVEREPLPQVIADGSQLVRVFQNLISNAVRFRGKDPPRVWVGAERRGGEWVFRVRDNGVGIPSDRTESAFQWLRRLHGPEGPAGSGMGLAICRRIVERHGGTVWIEPAAGGGTCVGFTLPAADRGATGSARGEERGNGSQQLP